MARYLQRLFGDNFGNAENAAQSLAQQGNAQAQQMAQIGRQNAAQMEQAAAMSQQAEAQRQAEEQRKRQQIMQIGMMIAGGGFGGGGEAAAGGAGTEATKAMANEAAEKAMLEVAPGMAAEKGMSLLGNYRDLGNAVGVTPYYDPRRLGLNFGF